MDRVTDQEKLVIALTAADVLTLDSVTTIVGLGCTTGLADFAIGLLLANIE
jgi:hypothetical protein